jgi:hypothetical protein
MLQALPDTGLWHRLNKEGRMIKQNSNGHQATLMNFMPTRPLEDIANEYVHAFWTLYDPLVFLNRTYRHFLILGESQYKRIKREPTGEKKKTDLVAIKALLILAWRQGVVRKTRFQFWINLFDLMKRYPNVVTSYLSVCAQGEHFLEYRSIVREQIESQLADYLANPPDMPALKLVEEKKEAVDRELDLKAS